MKNIFTVKLVTLPHFSCLIFMLASLNFVSCGRFHDKETPQPSQDQATDEDKDNSPLSGTTWTSSSDNSNCNHNLSFHDSVTMYKYFYACRTDSNHWNAMGSWGMYYQSGTKIRKTSASTVETTCPEQETQSEIVFEWSKGEMVMKKGNQMIKLSRNSKTKIYGRDQVALGCIDKDLNFIPHDWSSL